MERDGGLDYGGGRIDMFVLLGEDGLGRKIPGIPRYPREGSQLRDLPM